MDGHMAVPGRSAVTFALSQGYVEHQDIETLWGWVIRCPSSHPSLAGSTEVDLRLPKIWLEADSPRLLLSCCVLEKTLLGRGRKGVEEAAVLHFPSACSSEGPAWCCGALHPRGASPHEPLPALHPLQQWGPNSQLGWAKGSFLLIAC